MENIPSSDEQILLSYRLSDGDLSAGERADLERRLATEFGPGNCVSKERAHELVAERHRLGHTKDYARSWHALQRGYFVIDWDSYRRVNPENAGELL